MALSTLFISPTLQSLRLTLDETALRHQAIAANIANVNTPGYQRIAVSTDFENAYQKALNNLQAGGSLAALPAPTLEEAPEQSTARSDGNTVNLESEMVDLAQNTTRNEFANNMLINSYHGIKMAITGQVT